MTFWERVMAALRREKRDVSEALDELEQRANRELDARERELHATPEEKLEIQQERAAQADAELEAIRRRIEGS